MLTNDIEEAELPARDFGASLKLEQSAPLAYTFADFGVSFNMKHHENL